MKQNALTLSLVGGGIAFLCCFLPWIKIDIADLNLTISVSKESLTISGLHIATGNGNMPYPLFAAMVLTLVCLHTLYKKIPWKARKPALICSSIGFLLVLFTLVSFRRELSEGTRLAEQILEYAASKVELGEIARLQFGGFGAAGGFILAFIGAWNLPKSNISMENSE